MKNAVFFFFLVLMCVSLTVAKPVQLNGTVSNTAQGNFLYLYAYDGPRLTLLDSAEVKKGKVRFQLEPEGNVGAYNLGFSLKKSALFVFEGEEMAFSADGNNFQETFKVAESKATDEMQTYFNQWSSYDQSMATINKQFERASRMQQFNPAQFEKEKDRLYGQWDSIQKAQNAYFASLKENYPDVPYLRDLGKLLYQDESAESSTYLKQEDFSDNRWTRGEMLQRKINFYLTRSVALSPQNLEPVFSSILIKAPEGSKSKELTYEVLIQIGNALNPEYAKKLCKQGAAEFPASKTLKDLKKLFPPGVGDEAPDIALPNPEGEIMKLSDLRGNVVLLDFWASWCGPCIRESPNVVAAYNKYKDKGFTVYGVSLDGKKDNWVAAINKYGLSWPNHVSELQKWNSTAGRAYGVSGIPATFLIDENGIIIEKNLRGHSLQQTLARLLESE